MKKIAAILCVAALMLAGASALYAASNIYGIGGLIETPDDTITPVKAVTATVNYISDTGADANLWTFGGNYGLFPKLEVGAVGVTTDAPGADDAAVVNAKYRLLNETVAVPSVTIGIVDMADQLDGVASHIADPSGFIVVGKNITGLASKLTGGFVPAVKGTAGLGTGIYKGFFLGIEWTAAPKFSIIGEYLSNGLRQKTTFNAALRFQPIAPLSIQAGTFRFEGFYAGASYTLSAF